jgi:apolipoprotein D and lipocalin family protein
VAALFGCQTPSAPVDVVADVDLDRYLGRWYEIASLPQYFQRGCVATTALYSRRDDGRIRVENQCRDEFLDGPIRQAEGVAWPSEGLGSPGKLKVQFFWPFSGHYWIVALDPDYQWAMVGHPDRKYLWILARTRTLDAAVYDSLVHRAEEMGYDLSRLERTLQPTSE